MPDSYYKLDNPAWYALTETHANFAMGGGEIKLYDPAIVSFAAIESKGNNLLTLPEQFLALNESVFIIGDMPVLPSGYIVQTVLPCVQMICESEIKIEITTTIEKLGKADEEQMTSLITLVQPGYYLPGTRLMGDYFGIYQNNQLVSITGERMRMEGLTEISAVVTHPDFAGRKYAQQLVAHVANKNLRQGVIPFLHVAKTNQRAISIYEYLGFKRRRVINFTKIKRVK